MEQFMQNIMKTAFAKAVLSSPHQHSTIDAAAVRGAGSDKGTGKKVPNVQVSSYKHDGDTLRAWDSEIVTAARAGHCSS